MLPMKMLCKLRGAVGIRGLSVFCLEIEVLLPSWGSESKYIGSRGCVCGPACLFTLVLLHFPDL